MGEQVQIDRVGHGLVAGRGQVQVVVAVRGQEVDRIAGIADRGVTSLSRVVRREVTVDEVRPVVARRFAEVFGRRIVAEPLAGVPMEGAA